MKNNKFNLNLQMFGNNPDFKKTKEDFRQEIQESLEKGDTEAFAKSFTNFVADIEQSVMREAKNIVAIDDSHVLATRGVRQLTSKEEKFYQKTIEAMQSASPDNSLKTLDVVMPETVIDSIFEDLRTEHELLNLIQFQNVTAITKILLNTNARQLAQWGPLNSEITKELESSFKEIDMSQNKLSAFMFISQDMLDLGPVWIDRYVREVMYEALAIGLEKGIVDGTGADMPIGMNRKVSTEQVVGEYPKKDAIKVTSLDPIAYGEILSRMTKTEKGNPRKISNLIMVVNPTDYFTKIMPATTIRGADGTYVNNVLPYPTRVVQSVEVPEGEAIVGMADKYFMGLGLVKDGKIEHSDEYKFLEDYRTYKIRFLGHGQAKGETDFLLLDISDLKPAIHEVKVESDAKTPEA